MSQPARPRSPSHSPAEEGTKRSQDEDFQPLSRSGQDQLAEQTEHGHASDVVQSARDNESRTSNNTTSRDSQALSRAGKAGRAFEKPEDQPRSHDAGFSKHANAARNASAPYLDIFPRS